MNIRPALGFGAFALAAVVGAAFALNAVIGTPTANASGPDRELDPKEEWTYEPGDGAYIQCWIVIRESNVEGSNICSPGAHAKSIEKKTSSSSSGGNGYAPPADNETSEESSDTTVCYAEGLVVQQQCDVDGDASQITVLGLVGIGNGPAPLHAAEHEGEGGDASGDTTVCAAEGALVQQQCDVDGDASQISVGLPLVRDVRVLA